jgi:dipeptidyl aminopeptidase/acylaminoacyl peptidase
VLRSRSTESPNFFYTKDFKTFNALSNIYPERLFNWLTTELKEFKTIDGRMEQGILYKPENFDAGKKYPVLVHYYEKMSQQLNKFLTPGLSDGTINIPYFVSRGYLVFLPDIHYRTGEIGESAYNSIVAAGNYLSALPFVDGKRMGLTGHSFGAFETNYVITHSSLFTAALSDAGPSNFVSQYGSYELHAGISLQGIVERGQNRMGANLWERPDVYIKNSPIFEADKITTPVLMVCNKLDAIVHFEQGVQLFTALRRLGKKAWMLQYDGEAHSVFQEKNQMDLTIRATQFFDHYLKGKPAPKWMLDGTPAKLKGIETGYELDTTGRTPPVGLLTQEEKLKMDALQSREPVTLTLE